MNSMLNNILSALGEPYQQTEYGLLYNMDCVKGMKKIAPGLIDLTFTSPPYNIGKEYESVLPVDDYVSWCKEWIRCVYDLTSPCGAFLLNVGYMPVYNKGKSVPITYLLWDKTSFFLNQEIVWNYGAGVACKKQLSPRNEKILWYVKKSEDYIFNLDSIRDKDVKYPNQKKNGKLRCNTLGKNPSDVWQIAKVTSGKNRMSAERVNHPAQTPCDLLNRVVLGFSNEGQLVMDPFMGSGSTAVAALRNKRFYLGFEISEQYCKLAAQRISEEIDRINNENSLGLEF